MNQPTYLPPACRYCGDFCTPGAAICVTCYMILTAPNSSPAIREALDAAKASGAVGGAVHQAGYAVLRNRHTEPLA